VSVIGALWGAVFGRRSARRGPHRRLLTSADVERLYGLPDGTLRDIAPAEWAQADGVASGPLAMPSDWDTRPDVASGHPAPVATMQWDEWRKMTAARIADQERRRR